MRKFEGSPIFRFLPDKTALKIQYKNRFLKKLDLKDPKTFNQKLQWLKLYNRQPEYSKMVDKYEVKKIVAERIGEGYIIPTLGVWSSFDEIDFDTLPNQFVLKCTHGSGDVVIVKDKSKMDLENARKKMTRSLKTNYYKISREWPYKAVEPRIIAESYMEDMAQKELRDYKFFCFDGEPKLLFVATDRSVDCKFDFFDLDFNHLDIYNIHPNANKVIEKPVMFEEMKQLAAKLSQGLCQVRVDLYEINGKIYFGEWTFFHASGLEAFKPEEWDEKMGSWIKLPPKTN